MSNDIGGVWRTVGGRRVFIKDGDDLETAMKKSGKFKNLENDTINNNIISLEENNKIIKEQQSKASKYYEEREKELEKLNKSYKNKEISDDDYDKQWLKIQNNYTDKMQELKQEKVFDSKKEEVLLLKKSSVFTDEKKEYNGTQKNDFTDEEQRALTDYTGSYTYGSSSYINQHLNNKETGLSNELKQKMQNNIQNIDNAMLKSKIGGEYQLYRGIEPSKLGYPEIEDAISKINKGIEKGKMISLSKQVNKISEIKGKEIETKGFMSTSTTIDPNYTKRGVTLVINTKKDDKAIDIRNLSKYNGKRDTKMLAFYSGSVQTENEVLYDRNTTLKVKDYAITKDGIFLLCDTEQKKKK